MLTRLARLGCGGSGNAGECRGAGGTYSERRYRFPISGRFRTTYPKRESDTGAALTRTRGSKTTPSDLSAGGQGGRTPNDGIAFRSAEGSGPRILRGNLTQVQR